MIEINKKIANELEKKGIGFFTEFGAIIGDERLILVYKEGKIYLAHISEFEQKGLLIRLKEKK